MVLVFGTICLDRMRSVPRLPAAGGYVGVESETLMLGGEAANTAYALLQWGDPFQLWTNRIGEGPEADRLRGLLVQAGLPDEGVRNGPNPTPICEIYVTPDGERTMFGIGFDTIGEGTEVAELPFQSGGWFTADMNLESVARDAARLAQAAGMRAYLMDFLHADEPLQADSVWQSSTDWVGGRGDAGANLAVVKRVAERYGCLAVVTDGAHGHFVASSKGCRHYPSFPTGRLVDSTGAGDAFRAGMLHGLTKCWPLERCLAFASAAGSLACEGLGALGAVPSLPAVEARIAAHPSILAEYEGAAAFR